MKPVTLIMLAAGVWLLYSAIANKQPLGVLGNAVGYQSSSSSVTGSQDDAAPTSTSTPTSDAATPSGPASAASLNAAPSGLTAAQQNALLQAGINPATGQRILLD